MKTAAIYTRVSSDQQKENKTIESQVEALVSFTKEKGYILPEEYIFRDEGYSGAKIQLSVCKAKINSLHQKRRSSPIFTRYSLGQAKPR